MKGMFIRYRIPRGIPASVGEALRRYRNACARRGIRTRASQALLLAGLVVLDGCAFDRLIDSPGPWRAPLPWLALLALLLPLALLVRDMRKELQTGALAHALDGASGDRREHARAALDLGRHADGSGFFAHASLASAEARWRNMDSGSLADPRSSRRWACACLLGAALVAGLWRVPDIRAPLLWRRFLDPLGNHMRPTATWLEIERLNPGPYLTGDALKIVARLAGRKNASTTPLLRIERADGSSASRALSLVGDGVYQTVIEQMQGDFEWQLRMYPARSRVYAARVTPRPTILRITASYHYPRYARMAPTTERVHGRTLTALQGTRARVTLRANVSLKKAEARWENEVVRLRIARDDPAELVMDRVLQENHQLLLQLWSADGVPSQHEAPLTFKAIVDQPPTVSIVGDVAGRSLFLTDTIEIPYRAQDDLGLASLFVEGEQSVEIGLPRYGAPLAEGSVRIPVSDLTQGGARSLSLRLLARDTLGQETLSPAATIRIASDSFDRQMRRLMRSYAAEENDRGGMQAIQAHETRVRHLRTAANRIAMLADMTKTNQATGEREQVFVDQVGEALSSALPPNHYRTYWFSDFVYAPFMSRFREMGAYANVWAYLAIHVESLQRAFAAALKAPDPKTELEKLSARMESAVSRQSAVCDRVKMDYRMVARELAGYLASVTAQDLEDAREKDWTDPDFLLVRRKALTEIHGLLSKTLAEDPGMPDAAALDPIASAGAHDSDRAELEAVVPLLGALGSALRDAADRSALDRAHAAAAGAPWNPSEDEAFTANDRSFVTLASGLMLGSDNMDVDERALLRTAWRFLRVQAGAAPGPAGEADAIAARDVPGASDFDRFQTLMRARSDIEHFRLGVSNGRLTPGSPDLQSRWLRVREARLSLIACARGAPPALGEPFARIVEALSPFADWRVVSDWDSMAFLEILRDQERRCGELAVGLADSARGWLRSVDAQRSREVSHLQNALKVYEHEIVGEIAHFETTQSGGFGRLNELKVRLAALTTACLKMLDSAELAALHGVGEMSDLDRLELSFVGLGRVVRNFEHQVETIFWSHAGAQTVAIDPGAVWRGKVDVYKQISAQMADVWMLATSGTNTAEGGAAITRLQIGSLARAEQREIQSALDQIRIPSDVRGVLEQLSEPGGAYAVAWEDMLYSMRLVGAAIDGRETVPITAAQDAAKRLRMFERLPADARDRMDAVESEGFAASSEPEAVSPFSDVLASLSARLPPPPSPYHTVRQADATTDIFSTVDRDEMKRALQRQSERLGWDRIVLGRSRLAAALDGGTGGRTFVAWAAGEYEMNRRKAGLAHNRLDLGGVSLGSDVVTGSLPDHLYRELMRAREGNMPELFRHPCFDYLERVLRRARQ